MPKSQIIKDIVEEKASLEQSLNRLYILALDVKNTTLANWAEKELSGYDSTDELPEYRKAVNLTLRYTGINGSFQVTNQPLPLSFIKKEHRDRLEIIELYDSIRYLSELASADRQSEKDVSILAGEVLESTKGQVQCISIKQMIPQAIFQNACAQVKHKMIQALMELEKNYGNLDRLGIDISGKKMAQIAVDNAELNRTVLNINIPTSEAPKEKLPSKIAWNIIIPIITGIIGAVIGAAFIAYLGIG